MRHFVLQRKNANLFFAGMNGFHDVTWQVNFAKIWDESDAENMDATIKWLASEGTPVIVRELVLSTENFDTKTYIP